MIGGNLSGINFSGLATGIDTESIIQKLTELQTRPMQRLMVRKSQLQSRMSAFDQFRGLVNNLASAAGALSVNSAFNSVRGSSSDTNVATITSSTEALPGTYELRVSKLAQAHKIVSGAHASATAELGVSGQFMVNGKIITLQATDTLNSVAQKINAAGAGVTASVLTTDNGAYLTLTANETGRNSKIQLTDVDGWQVLSPALKLVSYDEFIRNQRNNAALSDRFRDSGQTLAQVFGMTSPTNGTIQINGQSIAVDFAADTLASLVSKINNAGAGVTASIETETDNGTTYYRLKIDGGSSLPTFVDDKNILKKLGILQNGYQNELVQAQDAEFTIDGFQFRRSRNQVNDAIQGVTITLLSADASNPKVARLTLTRDTEAARGAVNNFVNAFNSLVDFLKQNASINKETLQAGVLFGDTTVSTIMDGLINRTISALPNVQDGLRVLAQVGVQLGQDGKLSFDEGKFNQAMAQDLQGVMRLFTASGRTTDPNISFVSSTDKTKASPLGGYEVVITQAATRATATAGVAQTAASTEAETLTFSGALFGNNPVNLLIGAGSTQQDIVNQINNDSRLRNRVVASVEDGKLVIRAVNYGSASNFTVVSDKAASSSNSGIGTTAINAEGQDVAGTINGEPATGRGQFLTGNSDNSNTAGLQIRVTATVPGTYGQVHFTRGVADQVRLFARQATDIVNGDIQNATNTLRDQMSALDRQIESIREEVSRRQLMLREQFARMERAISQMQSQGARLAAFASSLPRVGIAGM
ncbi:MAG: flagellar filament capping protein FliD [Fimbriimonadales bacterium]|nr:flagellar filament capping protein FliD [Fimbriimonadales bacterium]